MGKLPVIEAAGSNYELGLKVGSAARNLVRDAVDCYRRILPREEGWSGPWAAPAGCLDAAREQYPHLVEELQGMADGSGQSFEDLFFLNALEEALDLKPKPPVACTAIALATEGGVWLGHNEDWYAEDARAVIAIYGRPVGKPSFLSVTAAPFLAAVGMNEAGIAQGVNSVSSTDSRVGVPRMFAARAALEASSIAAAKLLAAPAKRAGGYNHLLASAAGEIGNLETTATEEDYLEGERLVYHTNHYLSPKLQFLAAQPAEHSLFRLRRLIELEEMILGQPAGPGNLIRVLGDHSNRPLSICKHAQEQQSNEGTIFSVIFDLRLFRAQVAVGNPCGNIYREIEIAKRR